MSASENYSELLQLRLPPKLDRALAKAAALNVTTKSELVRQAIIADLRKRNSAQNVEVA